MHRLGACLLLLVGVSCVSDRRTVGDVHRDSLGVRIHEISLNASPVAALASTPVLEVGREEGDQAHTFSRILTAIWLKSGNIAVADGGSREVRIFSPLGVHLSSFGGPGAGPGEFSSISLIHEISGDSIAVIDNLNNRLSVFASDGTFARDFVLPRISGTYGAAAVGWLSRDDIVFKAQQRSEPGRSARESKVAVYVVSRDGHLSGEIRSLKDRDLGRNGQPLAFGSQVHMATTDSLIWYAHSERFEFRGIDRTGRLRKIIRAERKPLPVSERDIALAQDYIERDLAQQSRASESARQLILETEFASVFPVHGRIIADQSGNLWVQPSRSHLVPGPPVDQWDVLGPDGHLMRSVMVPTDLRVTQISTGAVLGVHTDSLGVERVRVHSISPAMR